MPLQFTVKRTVPGVDVIDAYAFYVNTRERSITVWYQEGESQPDGTINWAPNSKDFTVSDPVLYAQLLDKYRTMLRSDLYKLGQDVKEFPAGTIF